MHQLRLLNASLRLDKQKLRTKVDELNSTVEDLKVSAEMELMQKHKLNHEVDRLQEIALAQ